ncbi:hypothetical protein SS1G_06727 [Sclerotinia sclerotiorum 1980 UF-70]|uniref:DC-UbP/UBTD2 N-terminal domain-containing protein n=2 Tax=Sclerotinia sclerotiorum (strain ATCC 18683 / 1980 / Ss-1) TaxID=665079 RepID=A7EN28_SCLS1|nr:hypothetical protein SS1G_06727 [Sclerotinia sclerotiorum 1980 UF-70]APA14717.1 hypothetical protein sscle_13g094870 [Sclerotinia sclerotiorum 1980 UF-70]EDO04244.1 hypothetical protein SS1G_06727 [Sclerotinia sclerotiorum 1980 UF-70]
MGCCFSRPRTEYSAGAGASSSQAIASSSRPQSRSGLARPSTNASTTSNPPRHRHRVPLDEHINKPLRSHVWMSGSKLWTRREIDRARAEFFDTRVSGRPEIWQAIKAALEVMWKGGETGEEDGGLGTAQMILNAAEITLPDGDMAVRGCYDSSGALYRVPEHVVSDPANLLDDDTTGTTGKSDDEGGMAEESEEVDEEVLRRRETKGKAKAKEMIAVKARFQHGINGDIVFKIGKNDSVRSLVKVIAQKLEVSPPKYVKINYMGKLLKENASLVAQGWVEGHIVNAWILESTKKQ